DRRRHQPRGNSEFSVRQPRLDAEHAQRELKEGCSATGSAPRHDFSRPLRAAAIFRTNSTCPFSSSDIHNLMPVGSAALCGYSMSAGLPASAAARSKWEVILTRARRTFGTLLTSAAFAPIPRD